MSAQMSCPACGAARTAADRFCGSCGFDLSQAPAQPEPTAFVKKAVPAKTMLGMMSPMLGAPAAPTAAPPVEPAPAPAANPPVAPAPAPTSAAAAPKKTMLGMSPFAGAVTPALAQPSGAQPSGAQPSGAQPPGRLLTPAQPLPAPPGSKQTVFGTEETSPARAALESAQTPGPAPKVVATNRTMLGVAPVMAQAPAPQPSAPSHAGKPAAPQVIDPRTKQTMLGAAPPGMAAMTPPAQSGSSAGVAPEAAPSSPQPTPSNAQPRSFSKPAPAFSQDDDDEPLAPPVSNGKGLWIALAAILLIVAVGAFVALRMTRGPELSVRVVRMGAVETLEVQVPGSAPGAKVRFAGTEQPLTAGRAQFALAADSLEIGDNELAIDVVSAAGDVEGAIVALRVEYRVRSDLAALALDPPGIDIVVDAAAGSKVTLDGAPLALDAGGHAVKRYVVPPQTGANFVFAARYRIEGVGSPAQGEINLTLPVTTMQLDKPGPDVVTDKPSIEIAGGVEPSATVHIGTTAVKVNGGRFLYLAELPSAGDHNFDVIARAPGKAPRQVPIQVKRVDDMGLAAASFEADKSLTYARIAPNAVIYRGQKVAFDGRVYNVEVQGGKSLLQLLVLDCPGTQRCPLWVEYSQATDATVDTWVRVLGTVSGEQQFKSKQGQIQNVPSVSAQYVLKLAR